jgi:hypothetical protein
MRILGARHLVEAAAELHYGSAARAIAAGVDALHAASAVGFALFDQPWRRAALVDAAVATGFAIMGSKALLGGRTNRTCRSGHRRCTEGVLADGPYPGIRLVDGQRTSPSPEFNGVGVRR